MKNEMYEISGFNPKEKKEDIAYVIAKSPEQAVCKTTFFNNPVFTGKIFKLSKDWENFE